MQFENELHAYKILSVIVHSPSGEGRHDFSKGAHLIGGTQVHGARQTGFTAMTGTPDKSSSFATSSVTLAQLAGRVMALQAALTTHGLIGA